MNNGSMPGFERYKPFEGIDLPNRQWPNNKITHAPQWASVDLRDGNQALKNPMSLDQKVVLFNLLVATGFKQIEIGFPSASATEFAFTRYLIENNMIPDDVTIQVLTQTRGDLIKKTAESLKGAKNVIVHIYNSTSDVQIEHVFKKTKPEIVEMALKGVDWVKEYFEEFEGNLNLQYSPESFSGTQLPFALEICDAVVDRWDPKNGEKIIINIPGTVENCMSNEFADRVEFMHTELARRVDTTLSLHNHNDRGTGVAATELGILAGADRVEGTLLGNGERTGNMDIVTMAMNLYSQGIDSRLNFSNIDEIKRVIEKTTGILTHPRHPYAGELVYTAFSGSHQDAIRKTMDVQKEGPGTHWNVAYLPIDPQDVGRDYEKVIQVNSQSGKGGIAYILKENFDIEMNKETEKKMGTLVQNRVDQNEGVLSNQEIYEIYVQNFMND